MTTQGTALRQALATIIAQRNLAPNVTLTAASLVAAPSITVSSTAGFVDGGLLRWVDGTNEKPIMIDTVVGNVINLDVPHSLGPLQFPHALGAMVATNITTGFPTEVSTMITNSGRAVWALPMLDKHKDPLVSNHSTWQPEMKLSIGHLLPILQGQNVPLNQQLFTEQQTDQADTDTEALMQFLQANDHIPVNGAPMVQFIGKFEQSFRGNVQDYKVPVWETWTDVTVSNFPEVFPPV